MNMTLAICAAAVALGGALTAAETDASAAREILALERRALDGWMKGDPESDLAISDPAITYFHPAAGDQRLEGLPALRELFERYRGAPLFDSYEIVEPKVRIAGEVALLTFYFECRNGGATSRYDSTLVFERRKDGWRIVHAHWSKARTQ